MRKIYLIFTALSASFILTACGLTQEEITTYMTSLEASYQNGAYEQAYTEIEALDKSYNKMSNEQKSEFAKLKSSVEYAIESSDAITESLAKIQELLDKKMYFEASQEVDTLTSSYTIPPVVQKTLDEKKAAVDNGIKEWNEISTMNEAEQLLNSGAYDAAAEKLNTVDISALSNEYQTNYQSLQTKINDAKITAAAEAAAKAQASQKNSPVISLTEAKSIAAEEFNTIPASVTITDKGEYYYAYIVWRLPDGVTNESGCKINKTTGRVFDRAG